MKKLVALLLCLTMLIPMAALADSTFNLLLAVLSDENILGRPSYSGEIDSEGSNTCLLTVDLAGATVMLFADNAKGKVDAALWNDVGTDKMLALLQYYSEHYTETDERDTSTFVIGVKTEADGETLFITNAEEAAILAGIFSND